MDATAIKTLLEIGVAENQPIVEGAALVPNGWQYISTEKLQAIPNRQRRKFVTTRLGDFTAYCKDRCTYDSVVLIAPDLSGITAIINHGSDSYPDWGDNTAQLKLDYEASFKAFYKLTGAPFKQQILVDFLEDFSTDGNLNLLDVDGAPMHMAKAITAVRKITIAAKSATTTEVQTTRAARSSMEEIEARASENLPSILQFNGSLFPGMLSRTIEARLSVLTSSDLPLFSLRIMAWDNHLKGLSDEIEFRLRAEIEAQIYVGSSVFAG